MLCGMAVEFAEKQNLGVLLVMRCVSSSVFILFLLLIALLSSYFAVY